ncbi:hypothetical protein SNF32_09740 [Enterococcus mundtii]|nr:hypothetical protein [Enterococcus mundtii]
MPPKRFFPHAMIYRKKNGMGPRGEPILEEDLVIDHVRFDDTVKFEPRDIDGKVQTPNALISMVKNTLDHYRSFQLQIKLKSLVNNTQSQKSFR